MASQGSDVTDRFTGSPEDTAPGGKYYAEPKPPTQPDITPLELADLDIQLDRSVAAYRLSRAIADALTEIGFTSTTVAGFDAATWIRVAQSLGVDLPDEKVQGRVITRMMRAEVKGR